jgi:hypothetical protein
LGFVLFENFSQDRHASKNLLKKSRKTALIDEEIRKLFGSDRQSFNAASEADLFVPDIARWETPRPQDSSQPHSPLFSGIKPSARGADGLLLSAPEGFFFLPTKSYLLYREGSDINENMRRALDAMYVNFAVDIMPFSLFAEFKKLLMILFKTKESYVSFTGRPQWSAAAADVEDGAIYLMENPNFKSTLLHELTHIFYDGYFLPSQSPLWMSEGFAVYMQELGGAADNTANIWLKLTTERLAKGDYIVFEDFANADKLSDYDKEDVALWYAQAYSVIKFLIDSRSKDGFYQFSKNIKDGMPLGKALYRAYGMPFNTLSSLEYAWQADLRRRYK